MTKTVRGGRKQFVHFQGDIITMKLFWAYRINFIRLSSRPSFLMVRASELKIERSL